MITDIKDLEDGSHLNADAIVVGSGVAGSEVALYLARRGMEVLLLESGREDFDPEIQALNTLHFTGKPHRTQKPDADYQGYLPANQRGISRLRQFGGTSNIWTGKWRPFQRRDFGPRPWIPLSDWPISLDDLVPYYEATAVDYSFGDLEADARRPTLVNLREAVEAHGLKMGTFWWEEIPIRTRLRFGDEMRALPNLRVVLGATVTELETDAAGKRVTKVHCRDLGGRSITAEATNVVLCMGALEGARLLLASDRQVRGGLGNGHDKLGRFYSDHPKHHTGTLTPGPLVKANVRELQYGPKPRFCIFFALDDETQREHRLMEHSIYLRPLYEKRMESVGRMLRLKSAPRDGNGPIRAYGTKVVTEQMPNPESRLTLSAETDALGMRIAELDWRFTDEDHRSLDLITKLVAERFEAAGIGHFDFGDNPPKIERMTDAAHQMGTTRMSARPEEGVVDTDCRVWGTENLYVASSSVFPVGPTYSPTFTILALSRRIGERLVAEAGRSQTALSA